MVPLPRLTRQLISVAVAAMLAAVAVYGSYQPMHKSHLFREAGRNVGTIHTPAEFAALLSAPLEASSPIGQEELVRHTELIVLILIEMQGTPPDVTVALVDILNNYLSPILQRGKGIGFVQTLYLAGQVNVSAYVKTKKPTYLTAAENLFSRGLEASPKRPEFLYGLLDVYRMAKDTEKVKAVAGTILTQWPDDEGTRAVLAEYLPRPEAP